MTPIVSKGEMRDLTAIIECLEKVLESDYCEDPNIMTCAQALLDACCNRLQGSLKNLERKHLTLIVGNGEAKKRRKVKRSMQLVK